MPFARAFRMPARTRSTIKLRSSSAAAQGTVLNRKCNITTDERDLGPGQVRFFLRMDHAERNSTDSLLRQHPMSL
jgi:hypothetical protein